MKRLPIRFPLKKGKKVKIPLKIVIMMGVIVILIISFLYSTGRLYRDCNEDLDCFYEEAARCSAAKVSTVNSNNWYNYHIIREEKEFCIVNIKLEKMGIGSDLHLVEIFEGKEMLCKIPKQEFANNPISNIKGITKHCSGELKDSLQQLIIERMYRELVENSNYDVKKAEKLLKPEEI